MNRNARVICGIAFSAMMLFARAVRAAVIKPENPLGTDNVLEIFQRALQYLIALAVPVTAIMIVWGSLQMIFSEGQPEKFQKGLKAILYTLMGFGIILIASGIVAVVKDVVGVR